MNDGRKGCHFLKEKIQLINIEEVRETGDRHYNTSLMMVTGKIHHEM